MSRLSSLPLSTFLDPPPSFASIARTDPLSILNMPCTPQRLSSRNADHEMCSMDAFCGALPKIELHAHLNGCVRTSTLQSLASIALPSPSTRTLSECFALFATIHDITTDLRHVARITKEAIEDFAGDNVIYLELRTTPKYRPEKSITKESYMEAVTEGRDAYYRAHPNSEIVVKLILSIDRRENAEQAMETVRLACRLKAEGVVGIDLSGDPALGRFGEWMEALKVARAEGLKCTFHAGEVVDDAETQRLLDFEPERLGHMCFVNTDIKQQLSQKRIPVEICLTSNLVTKSVPDLGSHHLIELYADGHPVVICTDDPGVFSTTLTREYMLAADALKLDKRGIFQLAMEAVNSAFCDAHTKVKLRQIFKEFETRMFAT